MAEGGGSRDARKHLGEMLQPERPAPCSPSSPGEASSESTILLVARRHRGAAAVGRRWMPSPPRRGRGSEGRAAAETATLRQPLCVGTPKHGGASDLLHPSQLPFRNYDFCKVQASLAEVQLRNSHATAAPLPCLGCPVVKSPICCLYVGTPLHSTGGSLQRIRALYTSVTVLEALI